MNSIEKFLNDCHGNTIVASYWLKIDENRLFELIGVSEDREIPQKLLKRAKSIEIANSEVAALEEVVNDLLAKQERFVSVAEETIQIFTKDNQ